MPERDCSCEVPCWASLNVPENKSAGLSFWLEPAQVAWYFQSGKMPQNKLKSGTYNSGKAIRTSSFVANVCGHVIHQLSQSFGHGTSSVVSACHWRWRKEVHCSPVNSSSSNLLQVVVKLKKAISDSVILVVGSHVPFCKLHLSCNSWRFLAISAMAPRIDRYSELLWRSKLAKISSQSTSSHFVAINVNFDCNLSRCKIRG